MKLWMKQAYFSSASKVLLGLSAVWASIITWDLLCSINEIQISLVASNTVRGSSASSLPTNENATALLARSSTFSNNSRISSSNNNRKKHHLIIHIGPEKTASTTLQRNFYQLEMNENAFAADNYRYMGRYTTMRAFQEVLLYCPGRLKEKPNHPCYKRFLRLLEDVRWSNKNILLSEEVYSQAIWDVDTVAIAQQHFLPLLLERWDVAVVAVYRRFHDWIISARKQRDHELPKRQLWPQQGGEAMDSWKEVMLLRQQERFGLRSHYLPDDLAQWNDLNVNVTILNMHHPTKKITEQFVCDFLPNATNTCEFYRTKGKDIHANAKGGLTYFFDNIAYAAAAKGILDTTEVRRPEMVQKLTKSMNTSLSNLPFICPTSEDLEQLKQESIHWEQYYAPDHADLDAVKESFEKLVQAKQFCRVDTDRMLEGISEWSKVLQKLGDPNTASASE